MFLKHFVTFSFIIQQLGCHVPSLQVENAGDATGLAAGIEALKAAVPTRWQWFMCGHMCH